MGWGGVTWEALSIIPGGDQESSPVGGRRSWKAAEGVVEEG